MFCDTRQSIMVYGGIMTLYFGILLYMEVNSQSKITVERIIDMANYGINFAMHLLLLVAAAAMMKSLMDIFIRFLQLSIVLMILLIVIDIITGPTVSSGGHRQRRRRRTKSKSLLDAYVNNTIRMAIETAALSPAAAVEIRSVFGFKFHFVVHVLMLLFDIVLVWRLSGFANSMPAE